MFVLILGLGLFTSCQKESLNNLEPEVIVSLDKNYNSNEATLRAACSTCTVEIVKREGFKCAIRYIASEGCARPFQNHTWTGPFTGTVNNWSLSTQGANGSYEVTITDANGCVATASANVQDCEITPSDCCNGPEGRVVMNECENNVDFRIEGYEECEVKNYNFYIINTTTWNNHPITTIPPSQDPSKPGNVFNTHSYVCGYTYEYQVFVHFDDCEEPHFLRGTFIHDCEKPC